jgi:regulatory protein
VAAGLRRGQTLTEIDTGALLARDAAERATTAAHSFLARRPRSAAELREHLLGRRFEAPVVDAVCRRLAQLSLLDDEAFARWWVASRGEHRPRGRAFLAHELAARGVARTTIDAALATVDEEEQAARVAAHQAPRYRHLGRYDFEQHLGAFLQRRGFGLDSIRAALERAWPGAGAESPER